MAKTAPSSQTQRGGDAKSLVVAEAAAEVVAVAEAAAAAAAVALLPKQATPAMPIST